MKNMLLCLLSVAFLFSVSPAKAGFAMKTHALTAIATHTNSNTSVSRSENAVSGLSHPYYHRVAYGGWLGIVAVLCGIAGFFWGGFAILAILAGLMGMGRRHKHSALAIAGFVLGLTVLALTIFIGFTGFPLY